MRTENYLPNQNIIYKDDSPINTIHRARSILKELGIVIIEKMWTDNFDKLYSCRIDIQGTEIGTNGKGITQEYALASAYGEFLERIQNQIIFTSVKMNPISLGKDGFVFEPNEIQHHTDNVPALPESFKNAKAHRDFDSLYDFYEKNKNKLVKYSQKRIFVPFYDYRNNECVNMDLDFLWKAYGSNGMCAGNSPEEALSQGFSEIFERYAQRKVFYENVTPPTIPEEYISRYAPSQYELIKFIESKCNSKLIVKDCSLDIGFPVIAVINIFMNTNSYTVRFGGDPVWQISLERCLTEMFQGRNIQNYRDVKEMYISKEHITLKESKDFKGIITKGHGRYPNSLFYDNPTYEFKGYNQQKILNNKSRLEYTLSIIEKNGYQVFIRDTSFLNFPSYFIVMPGISEVYNTEWLKIKKSIYFNKVKYLSNLPNLNDSEIAEFIEILEGYEMPTTGKKENILLSEYVGIPVSIQTPWNQITLEFLLCMLYFRLSEYEKSQEKLKTFLEFAKTINDSAEINYSYHFVALQYIGLLSLFPDNLTKVKSILLSLYDKNTVEEVLSDFADKNKIFNYFPVPNNYECENCNLKQTCNYKTVDIIYRNFKKAIMDNPIDQIRLRNILYN